MFMLAILTAFMSVCPALAGTAHAGSKGSLRVAGSAARVPAVQGLPIEQAYDRLHHAGFRVSFQGRLSLPPATAAVTRQAPRAGGYARRGSIVKLRLAVPPTGAGSPAVPNELKEFTVPDFHGRPVLAAVEWAESSQLQWEASLPPLSAGGAARLLDNYAVDRQEPTPGMQLSPGRKDANGGFTPTPLKVRAMER
jgi:hypothetical protein